jgi:hypothetical protein
MRKLIYIPVVHNATDLGSLGNELLEAGEIKYGKNKWQEHIKNVNDTWLNIKHKIDEKTYNFANKIKIYQDGLPIIGEIGTKIINDCANNGSENYKIVKYLIDNGAKIKLAENVDFLLKEYQHISQINKAKTNLEKIIASAQYNLIAQELLNERDVFISNQINKTLNEEEIGIAFFGAIHSIIDKLDIDIEVSLIDMFKDEISLNLKANEK